MRTDESQRQAEEQFDHLVQGVSDYAIFLLDQAGRVVSWNVGAEWIKGYKANEVIGQHFSLFYPPDAVASGWPDEELRRAAAAGRFEDEGWRLRKDGSRFWANVVITALRDEAGGVRGFLKITRDLTERKAAETDLLRSNDELERRVAERTAELTRANHALQAEIAERRRAEATIGEQARLAEYGREIGQALTRDATLAETLDHCARATVRHLDAAVARIWTLNEAGDVLELQASAGLYTHLDGPHGRVPLGRFKIGQIAQERKPHLTNAVIGDPQIPAQDWARREGMVAFAGYPLVVADRLVGVLAMFARRVLSEATLGMMASVADEIAIGIERKRSEEQLQRHQEWLRVTLASIGDAVIATDTLGRVTFLNPVAEALTGWTRDEAVGTALSDVFRIIQEATGQAAECPAARALREGAIVGLANHTVLIARDGTARPIDDSAAPIRDESGAAVGAVLVFRDVARRREAERALVASEARKAAVLQSALDAIITIDQTGLVIDWNPAAEQLFGYPRATATGRELAELIVPPALREAHRRGLARHPESGAGPLIGRRIEVPALRADGSEFPVELAISRIAGDDHPLFTAHVRDISDRWAAERRRGARLAVAQALAEASTFDEAAGRILQAIVEGLGWDLGVIWTMAEDARVLRCLDLWHRPARRAEGFAAACRGWTFAPGLGLPGRVWASGQAAWVPDVTVDRNFPRGQLATDEGFHGAFAAPIMLGERFLGVLEFFSAEVREPDADLLEWMVSLGGQIGLFIERKRAEDELRDSERQFRTLAESIPQLAWMARPDGSVFWYNRRWYDYTGTSPAAMLGWGWQAVHDPAELPRVLANYRAAIASGEPWEDTFPLRRHDGAMRWHLSRALPVRDERGRIVRWFGSNTDITDRIQAERELRAAKVEAEEANQAKTQFLAVLSHELRTPLNPILLAATAMLERPFPPDELHATLEMVRQNVNLQARLIDDLLDVMRIVRGKMPLHWEVADCHHLIDQAVAICRSEFHGKELRLELNLAARQRHLNADPARLQQVFWNLIKNALKFTPPGGSITIRTRNETEPAESEDRIIIEVADTGIGIEPEVLPRIFDAFQQAETSITRKFGGLGLGLAICRGIVEAHGGSLTARSAGKDQGTTFQVVLKSLPGPVPDGPGEPASVVPAPSQAQPATLSILIVEDEPTTLRLMARLLRGLGHEVATAGTIAEALETFLAGDFDLIVSDIGLPDGSGLELIRRANAARGPVPAIALTGYGMEDDIRRSRAAGFTAHLTKPIDFVKLEAMIRQIAPISD